MKLLLPRIETWKQWGEIFTNAEIWAPVVKEICRSAGFSEASLVQAGFPGTNAVFVVNRAFIVKIFAPWCHKDYEKERAVYRFLQGLEDVPIPTLLACGVWEDRIQWPYLVLSYEEGDALRELWHDMSHGEQERLAIEMARIVRSYHEKRPSAKNLDVLDPSADAWAAFVETQKRQCVKELRQAGILPETVVNEITRFLNDTDFTKPADALRLLHADLTEDHTLVRRGDPGLTISALIDWADAELGPAEYEWVALWFGMMQRNSAAMRAFLNEYYRGAQWKAGFRVTAMAYTLLHRFGPQMIKQCIPLETRAQLESFEELMEILWPSCLTA